MSDSGHEGILNKKRRRSKVPENERLRKAVACTECQRQKSKCLGGFPCDRCTSKNVTCKSVTYVRISEDELLEKEQRLSYLEAIVKATFPEIGTDFEKLKSKVAELNGDIKAREMIKHINLHTVQQTENSESHTFYEDAGSTSSFVVRAREIFSHGALPPGSSKNKDSSLPFRHKLGNIPRKALTVHSDSLHTALSSLPSLTDATRLIDTFISVAGGNSFFYFDFLWYRGIFQRLYQKRSKAGLADVNHLCLVYMGFCMGSIFAHVWKRSDLLTKNGSGAFPGSNYFEHAQMLFPALINDSSIDTVQIFFMASMYVMAGQELEMAYTYSGMAMRAAVANGIHKRFRTGSDGDEKKAESRKRLFWSVYTIERRSAIALGRPETLPVSEIDLDLPTYCEPLDKNSENADVTCMTLIFTVSLLTIKIHDMWFRRGKHGFKFATIMDMHHSIGRWRGQIPPHLEIKSMSIGERCYRGAAHVHFAYNIARITLGRPFLLLKLRDTNVSADLEPDLDHFASQMVSYSYDAASQIVETLSTLKAHNLLSCYSFNDYNACHVASFVLFVYLALRPSTEALRRLNESVSILQQLSQNSKYTQKSTSVILNLKDAVEQRQKHQRWIDGEVQGIGDKTAYGDFRELSLPATDPNLGTILGATLMPLWTHSRMNIGFSRFFAKVCRRIEITLFLICFKMTESVIQGSTRYPSVILGLMLSVST
ncbi:LAFA_0F00694g1_1 [Lachancea sp. 'fantastica']|nr:LAFA_0F00694g1_1 [Lachancea sp. 'fantastica']